MRQYLRQFMSSGVARKHRILRRWWLYAVAAAGALLLLLLGRIRQAEQPPEARHVVSDRSARVPAPAAPPLRVTAKRIAARHPDDRPLPRPDERVPPAHLSDLNRTPDEDQLLWSAEEELVAACMRRRGFSYLPNAKDDDPAAAPGHISVDRRGDVPAARSRGYGVAARIQEGETPNPTIDRNAESLAKLTEAERAAFLEALRGPATSPADPGVRQKVESVPLPGGGAAYWYRDSCLAEARHRLYGTDYEHNELGYSLSFLRNELLSAADNDPEYRKALAEWQNCMQKRGFTEDMPQTAARRLAAQYHAGKLSMGELRTAEIAVATADTECFMASNLGRSRQAAESRAEEPLLAQNAEKLLAMKRERDEALARAETVLSEPDL